ncbi:hypothetical protein EIP91_003186 [Steccherinum ochraceum]|uniref:MYND-type domain-containing protein n=1 Tax=Steccherinum ochraceum TaxID=92696 RepID=A0A4R0RVT5_9APHY|nr:hypothetical protein EIP91_003186 [Steccherinum ochraceum]
MYFATEDGCAVPGCEYLHDKEACMRDREDVLNQRRIKLDEVTLRESMYWYDKQMIKVWRRDPELEYAFLGGKKIPEETRTRTDLKRIKRICANPECLAVQWKLPIPEGRTHMENMKKCSRCGITCYCSADCQKKDWKRHKTEPCLPAEELVYNDWLWGEFGYRKGTETQMPDRNWSWYIPYDAEED